LQFSPSKWTEVMFNNCFARFAFAAILGAFCGILCTPCGRAETPKAAASISASPVKRSFIPASIRALPGLQCKLYPAGSAPSSGILVFTDNDGHARFQAVKMSAGDAVKQLILDCTDTTGKPSTYSVDLTSDETFAPHPINLADEPGVDRPALSGDPLSYAQSQLLKAGYGLRPDPVANAPGYARWLAAASMPARLLQTAHPGSIRNSVIPELPQQRILFSPSGRQRKKVSTTQASTWYGAVMTGAPQYVFTEATFNVPRAIPGGDGTGNTSIYIWNGLGGTNPPASGLIQGIVWIQTTPTAATYSTSREYCCGDCQYLTGPTNCAPTPPTTGNQGYFTPGVDDLIFDEAWYCDAAGNQNVNGGYGCAFMQDLKTGATVSCTSYLGSPCSSVQAFPLCTAGPAPGCMILGQSAEFIIENGGGLTDFSPAVSMKGSATSSTGLTVEVDTDPSVTMLTDTSAASHSAPPIWPWAPLKQTPVLLSRSPSLDPSPPARMSVRPESFGCQTTELAVPRRPSAQR
jgi:hypothetical protein